MSDDLYDRDILHWSEQQASLLRRVAGTEAAPGVDWAHVVEEIEGVGLSELNSVRSYLRIMLVQLLKLHGMPESPMVGDWRADAIAGQQEVVQRFTPSMREKIDLARLYAEALAQVEEGEEPLPLPLDCPYSLDDLLRDQRAGLEAILNAASGTRSR